MPALRFPPAVLLAVVLSLLTVSSASAAPKASDCVRSGPDVGTKQTWACTWGPIEVGAYAVRQDVTFGIPRPPVDGAITNMSVDITDRDGTPVSIKRLMLHHIVFLNLGAKLGDRRDSTCGAFEMWDAKSSLPGFGERFYAAGEERAVLDMPEGYGYRSTADETWGMTWMVMNHRGISDSAYVRYTVTVDTAPEVVPATPYWLDVANCKADPVYDVPGGGKAGATHVKTADWTVPQAGRLIAGAGHVHGGAKELRVSEPACGDRTVIRSRPAWGLKDDPFYTVKPILHEPGPIAMSGLRSASGIPVAAGTKLRLSSVYDNTVTHTRVMGIMVVFLVPDASVAAPCGALPADAADIQTTRPHRTATPRFTVPLTGLDSRGRAIRISRPPGATKKLRSGSTITVGDQYFKAPNVKIRRGATLRWKFVKGSDLHNVTVASGPRGFSSPNLDDGRVYRRTLETTGVYRVFCALHPVTMTGTVTVTK